MSAPAIHLEAVSRSFSLGVEEVPVLRDISLTVETGESVAILGPSGSGKSTLMHIMGCLDRPTRGRYLLKGTDVAGLPDRDLARIRNRQIGFVFQSFNLVPRASALRNVMLPLVIRGVPPRERLARATAELERVGLQDRMNHLPGQLSGGQRQRVAIARALCAQPDILIADEPTGNLDSSTSEDIMGLLKAVHGAGRTLVVVTHDAEVARRLDRQITIRDGRIHSDHVHAHAR